MVLDKMDEGNDGQKEFVFKNTYTKDDRVRIKVDADEAPDEFFFVHINYTKQISFAKAAFKSTIAKIFRIKLSTIVKFPLNKL